MAAKKKKVATRKKKKAARKKAVTQKKRVRGKLAPRKEKRGLSAAEMVLPVDGAEVATLIEEVQSAGGAAIGAYREPFSGRPILMAA